MTVVGEPMEQKRLPLLLLLLAGGGGVADVMVIEVGGWIIYEGFIRSVLLVFPAKSS